MAIKRTNDHLITNEDRSKKLKMMEHSETEYNNAGPSQNQIAEVPKPIVEPRPSTPQPSEKGKAKEVVSEAPEVIKLPTVKPNEKGKAKEVVSEAPEVIKLPTAKPKKKNIRKLVPTRPFPTVPTSVSATGPRSAHKEGKNLICLSRRTSLGTYMRRCKDVIMKDGYKTIHLSAMGAAIPLLLQLTCALPPILPFSKGEIHTEITTGTCEVQDEILPDDDDEDITYQTRCKSTLMVIIKIGNGEFEGDKTGPARKIGKSTGNKHNKHGLVAGNGGGIGKKGEGEDDVPSEIVYQEPEQDLMEMM